jgi:hypothetical protein
MEINERKIIQAVVRDITDRKRDEDVIKASLAEKEFSSKKFTTASKTTSKLFPVYSNFSPATSKTAALLKC